MTTSARSSRAILSFISGKGGTGKTTTCIAVGYLLANAGFSTMLVDADPATHGMSYFFSHIAPSDTHGLCEAQTPESVAIIPITDQVSRGTLAFTPSITNFRRQEPITNADDILDTNLRLLLTSTFNRYDFVLLDCQAGITRTTLNALAQSQHAIVVTEADPVSVWAITILRQQIIETGVSQVWGLVNRVMPGEESYYQALVDVISNIKFVGQLPFDTDVRRAFFRREVPIDISNPSAFVLALVAALQRILPEVTDEINTIRTVAYAESNVHEEDIIRKLEEYRRILEAQLYEATQRTYQERWIQIATVVTAAALATGAFAVLETLKVVSFAILALVGGLVAIAALGVLALGYQRTSRWGAHLTVERAREELRFIDQQISEYRLLEVTRRTRPPGR